LLVVVVIVVFVVVVGRSLAAGATCQSKLSFVHSLIDWSLLHARTRTHNHTRTLHTHNHAHAHLV
jgi:hypothetical protein